MSRPLLLITRPAEEAARTAWLAEAAGFGAILAPLLTIEPVGHTLPEGPHDAILFTSARAPSRVRGWAHDLPVWAVGPHTADAARAAGFRIAGVGDRDGSATLVAAAAAGARRLLHLAGEALAPLAIPKGLTLDVLTVYRARPVDHLPPDAVAALSSRHDVGGLLLSPRTAALYRTRVCEAGLDPARLSIVTLSAAVTDAAGPGWQAAVQAARPRLDAAVAAAARHFGATGPGLQGLANARALWQGSGDA